MARFLKDRTKSKGAAPGSLIFIGKQKMTTNSIQVIQYTSEGLKEFFPENMEKLCCGTIWESKGMADIAERKVRELEEALYKASCGGRYPVVCDQSPCLHRMKQCITKVKLYDSAEFIWDFLREKLEFHQINEPIALHVTCSTKHMKLDKMLYDLARLCSPDVLIPEGVGCCGFGRQRDDDA